MPTGDDATAPLIVIQPASSTVAVGEAATFSASVVGTPPLELQWLRDGDEIRGAVADAYTTPPLFRADSGSVFTLRVDNVAGQAVSRPATVTVVTPPSITLDPRDTTVVMGQSARFFVEAAGSAPLAYQWYRNGVLIPGANHPDYRLEQTTVADDAAGFRVRVENAVGAMESAEATLTLTPPPPPEIVTEPRDTAVEIGEAASFSVAATGSPPITYQWFRDGAPIPGADSASYTIDRTSRPDSLAVFRVRVSNPGGSVDSRDAHVAVTGAAVYGLSGFLPELPNDLVGLRFRVLVKENLSESLRLIFGFFGVWTPGSPISGHYSFEANVYSGTNHFPNGACSTWPPQGRYVERKSSVLFGLADYPYHREFQPGPTIGMLTGDPVNYPVQTALIDGIPRLWKSTARSQEGMDGKELHITVLRGDTLSDVSAFERCGLVLEPVVYRRWFQRIETPTGTTEFGLILPEEHARYIRSLHVLSEFLHGAGEFTVQYWDFESLRDGAADWIPATRFRSTYLYDGNGRDFGARLVPAGAGTRIELSNVPGTRYFVRNQLFEVVIR